MTISPIPVVALIFIAAAVARSRKKGTSAKRPPVEDDELEPGDLSPADAIQQAIAEMRPGDSLDDATNRAYWLAYPDCPEVLDSENPDHDECVDLWMNMRKAIDTAVSEGAQEPDGQCDPLDPSTWPEGMICVDTSGGWRALPKDEAEACKSKMFASEGEVWVCLSDGKIENLKEFAARGPFAVSVDADDGWLHSYAVDNPKADGSEWVGIILEAPNPRGKAGVRALYLALQAAKENPTVIFEVNLVEGPSPRGVPKYQVVRERDNVWLDEVWLPVDEGWDQNIADTLKFVEETY